MCRSKTSVRAHAETDPSLLQLSQSSREAVRRQWPRTVVFRRAAQAAAFASLRRQANTLIHAVHAPAYVALLDRSQPRGWEPPTLLGAAAAAHVRDARGGAPFASALDAGCGTGLVGPHLRPLVTGTLAGVDLSPKMLDRAAELRTDGGGRVYDVTLAADLTQLQRADVLPDALEAAAGVELIAAADVHA